MKPPHERRNSPRFPARTYLRVQTEKNIWDAHLLDISATGARMAVLAEHGLQKNDAVTLYFELDENEKADKNCALTGKVVHVRDHIIGVALEENQPEYQTKIRILLEHFG